MTTRSSSFSHTMKRMNSPCIVLRKYENVSCLRTMAQRSAWRACQAGSAAPSWYASTNECGRDSSTEGA